MAKFSHILHSKRLRDAFMQRITVDEFGDIADKLIKTAKKGDVPAMKLALEYGIGKPAQPLEFSGNTVKVLVDGETWKKI